MLELKLDFTPRDLDKQSLSESELDQLIGKRDYKEFLNARNELYRKRQMAKHPNLIRRPLLIRGSQIVIGFNDPAYRDLATRS